MHDDADAKRKTLDRLLAAHEAWFDVARSYEFAGRVFPGYAEFHSTAEKYVLVKRAKLWGASVHEYLFFELSDRLTKPLLGELLSFMTEKAIEKVQVDAEHMTSYLSLVVIADHVDVDARKAVSKAKFRKSFKFGFQGWADLRVAAVDLSDASVTTNAMGRELRKTLVSNVAATTASLEGCRRI